MASQNRLVLARGIRVALGTRQGMEPHPPLVSRAKLVGHFRQSHRSPHCLDNPTVSTTPRSPTTLVHCGVSSHFICPTGRSTPRTRTGPPRTTKAISSNALSPATSTARARVCRNRAADRASRGRSPTAGSTAPPGVSELVDEVLKPSSRPSPLQAASRRSQRRRQRRQHLGLQVVGQRV